MPAIPWHIQARKLRKQGLKLKVIAERLGKSASGVQYATSEQERRNNVLRARRRQAALKAAQRGG